MRDGSGPSREAILTAAAEHHQISLSELSNRLEADFGSVFREVEALIEAGELVRVNHFTYRPARETPADGPESEEADAADGRTAEEPRPGPPEAESRPAEDEARRAKITDDAPATAPSTRRRAAAGLLALVGVILVALGAIGLYLVLVGELIGVLTAETVTGLVGDLPPELLAGGAAGLAVLGVVSVLGGWFIARDRSGRLAGHSERAPEGNESRQAKD